VHGAAVAVCRGGTTARRTPRLKRRAAGRRFLRLHLARSPRAARPRSRGRCGSATSDRWAGRVRGWTTRRQPASRFILLALAFGVLNVWIPLRWLFTPGSRQRRPGRDTTRGPLTRFALFIRRTLEYL